MQRKPLLWFLTSLLCLAGAIFFWKLGDKWQAEKAARGAAAPTQAKTNTPAARPQTKVSPAVQARLAYRLSNTDKSLNQLARDDKGIILANALIDTGKPAVRPEDSRSFARAEKQRDLSRPVPRAR